MDLSEIIFVKQVNTIMNLIENLKNHDELAVNKRNKISKGVE